MYRSDKAAVLFKIADSTSIEIPCLGEASISSTMEIDSRSCIGVSTPQKTAMSMDWSVSFNGVADLAEEGVQEKLFEAYKSGVRIKVVIIYKDEPAKVGPPAVPAILDGYEGTILISDWSVSLSAPGVAELSFTGQGTSELFLIHEKE